DHPLQSGAPFDGEGIRRRKITLVDKGTVKDLVYARSTAVKMRQSEFAGKVGDIQLTGHGFPLPNEMGEAPANIVFLTSGGEQTTEQMIGGTEHGILVTRLWYIREVDPYEKILTGMTRDGTFLIEGGKVKSGIRNFRFNQSLIEIDRKSTRLNSSHLVISYAVFCLKKKIMNASARDVDNDFRCR